MEQEPLRDLEVIQTNTKCYSLLFPFDISGCVIYFTVKKCLTDLDSTALIALTIDCPYNSNSEAGKAFINLTSELTTIDVGNYFYDIKFQRNDSGGGILQRHTIGTGIFRVNLTVTQRTNG